MPRTLKLITSVLVLLGLLGLFAGAAFAKTAPTKSAHLDLRYGWHGSYVVATPRPQPSSHPRTHIAVAGDGEAYVLLGRTLLAFSPDGKPDHSFGKNGRIWVNPGPGLTLGTAGIAVDREGRVLVAGTYIPLPGFPDPIIKGNPEFPPEAEVDEGFVARYLTGGAPDPTFGSGGVVITSFGVPRPTDQTLNGRPATAEYERPSVELTQLTVDSQDRPVVAGAYASSLVSCGWGDRFVQSFAARLTSSGAPDLSFGGSGYVKLPGGATGSMALGPGGELAALSSEEFPCSEHSRGPGPRWFTSVLTEGGGASPTLDPARPVVEGGTGLAIDPQGRLLFMEWQAHSYLEKPGSLKIVRLLANGDLDTGFGHGGATVLTGFEVSNPHMAVDGKGRTVVAFGSKEPELIRITSGGKIDHGFHKKGALRLTIQRVPSIELEAVAIDSQGRILVAGSAEGSALKTGIGVAIARVLPGS